MSATNGLVLISSILHFYPNSSPPWPLPIYIQNFVSFPINCGNLPLWSRCFAPTSLFPPSLKPYQTMLPILPPNFLFFFILHLIITKTFTEELNSEFLMIDDEVFSPISFFPAWKEYWNPFPFLQHSPLWTQMGDTQVHFRKAVR